MAKNPLNEDGRWDGVTELWIEEVFLHNDLPSVQKSMAIEGWLTLVDVQDNVESMAAACSS